MSHRLLAVCGDVMAVFVSRLLSELNAKESEYQELLRTSVLKKQEQIDAIRKYSAGKIYIYINLVTKSSKVATLTASV